MTEHAEVEIVYRSDPVMLPPSATVMMAARHMRSRNVSAVLVTEGDAKLIGIFTERDAISRVLAEGKDPVATTLAEVMTDNPDTVAPQATAVEVVRMMQAAQCRHLPIVHEGKAVGMVSRGTFRRADNDGSPNEPTCESESQKASVRPIGMMAPVA
jgi:signal-transduction protein with cAMP-binding, CBS, and nucleotidyltransferase domain